MRPEGIVAIGPFSVNLHVNRRRAESEAVPLARHAEGSALLALANLLGACGHLIKECSMATCHRWFVAARRGQKFCGRKCQNAAAADAYRIRLHHGRHSRTQHGS
jgi:hypothetical protein